jgi:hypothetical protein
MVSRDTSWARSGDREALREALLEALDEALDRGLGILLLYTPSRGLSRFEGGESVILRISLFEPMNIGPTCGEDFGDPAATGSGDVLTLPFPCPSGKITSTSSENVLKKSLGHCKKFSKPGIVIHQVMFELSSYIKSCFSHMSVRSYVSQVLSYVTADVEESRRFEKGYLDWAVRGRVVRKS